MCFVYWNTANFWKRLRCFISLSRSDNNKMNQNRGKYLLWTFSTFVVIIQRLFTITCINCVFYQIFYQNYIKLNCMKLQNLNVILLSKNRRTWTNNYIYKECHRSIYLVEYVRLHFEGLHIWSMINRKNFNLRLYHEYNST